MLAFSLLCCSARAAADDRSAGIIGRMGEKFRSAKSYEASFEAVYDGNAETAVSGKYVVKGDKYHIATDVVEVFCDGRTRWEANTDNREVVIDGVDRNDRTLLGNPTRAFDLLDGSFSHSYSGEAVVDGSVCDVVKLVPADAAGSNIGTITLAVNRNTALPARIVYAIGDAGDELVIDLRSVMIGVAAADSLFVFPKNRFRGVEIIDFR